MSMEGAELRDFLEADLETDVDALELAREAIGAGLINPSVLDHLNSLQPEVPNSMKLRYFIIHLYNAINRDKKLFLRMVQVFLAFRSHPIPSSSSSVSATNDFPLGTEHIPDLAELLVDYASRWRSIGTAMRFKPQDLDNIQASLLLGSLDSFLLRLIEDWILRKHTHTLPPTTNNLENVLNSRLVGLGVVACELRSNITLKQRLSVRNQALPYFVECVTLSLFDDFVRARTSYVNNTSKLEAEENGSVLLEVQVICPPDEAITVLKYQWHVNGLPLSEGTFHAKYTGFGTPILCVSDVNTEMDGLKYSCEVIFSTCAHEQKFISKEVTLRVRCPLDEYRSGLASVYLAQCEVPDDTWPPISNTKHINLALIKQDTRANYTNKYVHHTIRGDMDDILQDKQRIEYADVLKDVTGTVLFIEGRPGSGKTTFVHKITRDWATAPNKCLRLVLLVSLRVLNNLNKPSLDLSDILNLFEDLKLPKELLENRNGKNVCFIFDGLDEFSPRDKKDSMVYKIINKKYLSLSSVFVASRPAAIAEFRSKAKKIIEVLGFPNQQIFEYFDSYNFSVGSKSKDLKAYLEVHPNILHMCYLPIHAAMVAFLFEVTGKVPRTETEIYQHFTNLTILRSLTKNPAVSVDDIDVHNLSGKEQKLFSQICKLALEKTIANKQVLHQDEIGSYFQSGKSGDISLGLITVDRTAGLYGFKNMYTFLHLTFQEYLAAYHISTLSSEDQHKLIQSHGDKDSMLMVWKFLCGLIKVDVIIDNKFHALARKALSLENTLYLVQSAYESQEPKVCDILLELVQATFRFEEQHLTTPDFTALGYVMAHASAPLFLSLKDCNISCEAVDAMLSERDGKRFSIHTLQYHFDTVNSDCLQQLLRGSRSLANLEIYSLTRNSCALANNLFDFCMPDLTMLSIKNVRLGPGNLQTVLMNGNKLKELTLVNSIQSSDILNCSLENCTELTMLDISYNDLAAAEVLAPGLAHCKKLETLIICNNSIASADVKVLLGSLYACKLRICSTDIVEGNATTVGTLIEGLTDCNKLQELQLFEVVTVDIGKLFVTSSRNWLELHSLELHGCIGDTTACYVSYTLPFLTNLKVLRILGTQLCILTDYGVTELARNLGRCTILTEFLIRYCEIGYKGIQDLADALKYCKNVSTLDMSYNNMIEAERVFTIVGHMSQLTALNLSGNAIQIEAEIISSLDCCTGLRTLNLNEIHIGKPGAIVISSHLQHWPNLQALGVCGNGQITNVGKEGAALLAKNLSRYCTKLEVLNLSCNDIDERIATSLVKSLAKCTNLAELYLENNRISEDSESIKQLQTWQHLKHLSY